MSNELHSNTTSNFSDESIVHSITFRSVSVVATIVKKQKETTMLVEIKDVEVHIEPIEVLSQALQEYDLSITDDVSICIDESDVSTVLESIDNESIRKYCYDKDINIELKYYEQISSAVKEFSSTEKAMLLWQLLKEE